MILAEAPLNVEYSATIQPTNFRIKASAKAFAILSRLYTSPIAACIRELSCNAMDAHVDAGKSTTPFEVHLPNALEPYFYVKDDGTGMSNDKINALYTTYFDSDKVESNDFNGALGLGSKSPFFYTNQFTVESRYNGVRSTYSCFVGEDGVPAFAQLGKEETNEGNGLKVSFAVKSSDFYEFERRAKDVLSWFVVKPRVIGCAHFQFDKRDYMLKTDKYGLCSSRVGSSYVVMGDVAYICRPNDLRSGTTSLTDLERRVMEWGCDLFVPMGSVSFTPNREEVSYGPMTVAIVKQSLEAAVNDIKKEIERDISNAPTLWRARRAVHDARHSILGQIRNIGDITWHGQEIHEYVSMYGYNNKLCEEAKVDSSHYSPVTCYIVSKKMKTKHYNKIKYRKEVHDRLVADGRPIFVEDLDRGGYTRVVLWMEANNIDTAYYCCGVSPRFIDESGIGDVMVLTSTLPKTPRQASKRNKGSTAKLNEFNVDCSSNNCVEYWKPAEVDLAAGGIYVEISYFRYKLKKQAANTDHPHDLVHIMRALKTLGYKEKVYGIRPADVKILEKHEGWVSLEAFIEAVLAEHEQLEEELVKTLEWQTFSNSHLRALFDGEYNSNSLFAKLIARAKDCVEAATKAEPQAYKTLMRVQGTAVTTDSSNLQSLYDLCLSRYKLLKHLEWWNLDCGFHEAVAQYINAVDDKA